MITGKHVHKRMQLNNGSILSFLRHIIVRSQELLENIKMMHIFEQRPTHTMLYSDVGSGYFKPGI